jgi:enamine deaminase RidA (YjgF/YER057c/UK114 family)
MKPADQPLMAGGIRMFGASAWMLGWFLSTAVWGAEVMAIDPQPSAGRSAAVVVADGPLLHTGQLLPGGPFVAPTAPDEQVRQVFSRLEDVLKANHSRPTDVVKLNFYVAHPSVMERIDQELAARYAGPAPPAVSVVQTAFAHGGVMVAVDAVARTASPAPNRVVRAKPSAADRPANTALMPPGPHVYISGQAEKGDGTLADATRQTMRSLIETLRFLELSTADVVHVKAFLTPIADAAAARQAILAAFPEEAAPPLSFVEWISSLPIEIELIASAKPRPGAPRIEYLTPPGMTASPIFARVVRVNVPQRVYTSGLFGRKEPQSAEEVHDLFAELKRIVEAGGSDLRHLAKATYYVSDETVSRLLNEIRPEYYAPDRPPAASKALVAGTGRPGRRITLDMIAVPRE